MRDNFNRIHPLVALAPKAAVADNSAQVGAIIDSRGFSALTYLLATGVLTDADATFTVLLEHGDLANGSDMTAVPDELLIGTEVLASFDFSDDGETRKLGYAGDKRYTRITVTPANNTGNLFLSIIALLARPHLSPTPNPPV